MHRFTVLITLFFLMITCDLIAAENHALWTSSTFPEAGAPLDVCVLRSEEAVAIILSDDLTARLTDASSFCLKEGDVSPLPNGNSWDVFPCGPDEPSLGPSRFVCDLCGVLAGVGRYEQFVLYRQIRGREFEEVGFFNDNPACVLDLQLGVPVSHVASAPLYFLRFDMGGVSLKTPESLALRKTLRLVLVDRSQPMASPDIRYKLVTLGRETGSPSMIHTSDWLSLSGL